MHLASHKSRDWNLDNGILSIIDYFLPGLEPDRLKRRKNRTCVAIILIFLLILPFAIAISMAVSPKLSLIVGFIVAAVVLTASLCFIRLTGRAEEVLKVNSILGFAFVSFDILLGAKTLFPAVFLPLHLIIGLYSSKNFRDRLLILVIAASITLFLSLSFDEMWMRTSGSERADLEKLASWAAFFSFCAISGFMGVFLQIKDLCLKEEEEEERLRQQSKKLAEYASLTQIVIPNFHSALSEFKERFHAPRTGALEVGSVSEPLSIMLEESKYLVWLYQAYDNSGICEISSLNFLRRLKLLLTVDAKYSTWMFCLDTPKNNFLLKGAVPLLMLLITKLISKIISGRQQTKGLPKIHIRFLTEDEPIKLEISWPRTNDLFSKGSCEKLLSNHPEDQGLEDLIAEAGASIMENSDLASHRLIIQVSNLHIVT